MMPMSRAPCRINPGVSSAGGGGAIDVVALSADLVVPRFTRLRAGHANEILAVAWNRKDHLRMMLVVEHVVVVDPEIRVVDRPGEQIRVEVLGLDVNDPQLAALGREVEIVAVFAGVEGCGRPRSAGPLQRGRVRAER